MAHIKVVRRSMRPEEWTDLRFEWLKRHIYAKKYEIKTLQIRDARQVSEMEYAYYEADYRPLIKGDVFYAGRHSVYPRGYCHSGGYARARALVFFKNRGGNHCESQREICRRR